MSAQNPVPRIYRAVIDDVMKNVRESFLNEGIDEQVLLELKQLWENKLLQSRAIEFIPSDVNVRVSLTYPHNVPQMQGIDQPGQQQQQQQTLQAPPPRPPVVQPIPQPAAASSAPTAHIMQNQAGQLVYVSTHPTLGNVGPMSGAAAQAAMALQSADGRRIIPQQIRQLPGAQNTQAATIYQRFQAGAGQSVILTPAQAAQAQLAAVAAAQQAQQQQQQQAQQQVQQQVQQVQQQVHQQQQAQLQQQQQQVQQDQKPQIQQHIIQVDGASDEAIPSCALASCSGCGSCSKNENTKDSNNSSCSKNPINEQSCSYDAARSGSVRRKPDKNTFRNIDIILQMDGANDSDESDDLDGDDDDEDYDNYPIAPAAGAAPNGEPSEPPLEEEEPLNSEDDVSDDDPTDLFDTDNVVVCQYDKIARTRNRWKFHLKDGIMNLKSKDYVFHKANGDSEW